MVGPRPAPGRGYEFEVRVAAARPSDDGPHRLLYGGRALTAPHRGDAVFVRAHHRFTHPARDPLPATTDVSDAYIEIDAGVGGCRRAPSSIRTSIVILGDTLDFHDFGFNNPPPDSSWTRLGYLNYRRLLGDMLRRAAPLSCHR